ncbi:MAG: hypothetical protein HY886_10430 [Deltaproteobacteria bacterium]|nr:hypothetical protein [Deltaproteobacteria bacterium]
MRIQETMRERFLKAASEKTRFDFTVIEGYGPAAEGALPDYRLIMARGAKGIDTVHEITVRQFGLKGTGQVQPDLALFMTLQARVVRTVDNAVLFNRTYDYHGDKHKFAEWAANDARLFKEEFDRCYQRMAEDMLRDVYILNTLF